MSKLVHLTFYLTIIFLTCQHQGVNCNFSTAANNNSETTLKIFSLGRPAQLGSLYDARTQKFTGDTVFLYDSDVVTISSNHSDNNNETHDTIHVVSKPSHLFKLLGLDPLTAVGVHTGLIKVIGGHAGFLNADKYFVQSHAQQVIIWKKIVETVTENLNLTHDHLRETISFDNFKNSQATHVVTGVGWGVGISARIQFPKLLSSMDPSFEDFQGNSSQILLKQVMVQTGLNYSIKIHSDVPIRGMTAGSQKFSQLIPLMETPGLPSLLEKTRWKKGKKLTYTMTKIDHFLTHFVDGGHDDLADLVENLPHDKKIDAEVLENCVKLFDDISQVHGELDNLEKKMEENSAAVSVDDLKKNLELAQNFDNASTRLMTQLGKKMVQVSGGHKENSDLKWFLKEYEEDDEFSWVKVKETLMSMEQFGRARMKIEFSEFVRSKKTIQYIGGNLSEINFKLPTTANTSLYLLIFRNLPKISKSLVWLENRSRFFQLHASFPNEKYFVVDCDYFDGVVSSKNKNNNLCSNSNLTLPTIQEYKDGGLVSRNLDLWIAEKAGDIRQKELKLDLLELKSMVSELTTELEEYMPLTVAKMGTIESQLGEQTKLTKSFIQDYCNVTLPGQSVNPFSATTYRRIYDMCVGQYGFPHPLLDGLEPCGGLVVMSNGTRSFTYWTPLNRDKGEEETFAWVIWNDLGGRIGLTLEAVDFNGAPEWNLTMHNGNWNSNFGKLSINVQKLQPEGMGVEVLSTNPVIILVFNSKGPHGFRLKLRHDTTTKSTEFERVTAEYLVPPPIGSNAIQYSNPVTPGTNYLPNERRFMLLKPVVGAKIGVTLNYFHTETTFDPVRLLRIAKPVSNFEVYVGWTGGPSTSTPELTLGYNQLTLVYFRSNEGTQYGGFKFSYRYKN